MSLEASELDRRFFEPIKPFQPEQNEKAMAIRNSARVYAALITAATPEGREQCVAIAKLEEVVFWSLAALGRQEEKN